MSDNNRFKDVMNAARNQSQVPYNNPQQQPQEEVLQARSDLGQIPQPVKRGRPAGGKRNNPQYEQVAAYIPKDLYKRVRMRLLEMEPEGQFSDLVEFLLNKWIQSNPRQQ